MPRYIAENDVYNLFNARGAAQLHVGDIDVLPRVDVIKVVHGRWVHKGAWHIACSECKHVLAHIGEAKNYCPNCGVKMDLEEKRHEIF